MPWEGPPVDRSRAFRPNESFDLVDGLQETVFKLIEAKRYRSALTPILEVLSSDPNNEHALRLAIAVFSASETSLREAVEPLELAQWNDARLDSIFAECSKCKNMTWVPHAYLMFLPHQSNVINPVGMQCHACGYVLCRECVLSHEKTIVSGRFDSEVSEVRCPSCRGQKMHTMIYPTGRERRELRKPNARITHVFLFRAGPVAPDAAYLQELLPVICSQAMEDRAHIRVFPMFPWPEHMGDVARFYILAAIDRGELPKDAYEHAMMTAFVDQDKNPGYLIAIAEPGSIEYDEIMKALQEKRYADAVPLLQKMITVAPDVAVLHNDLGFALIRIGQLALAFETLDRALSLEETAETHCNLGLAHIIARNLDTAVEHLEKALALKPRFRNAVQNLEEARDLRAKRERNRHRWGLAPAPARPHEWASYRGDSARCAYSQSGPLPPFGVRWQFETGAIIDGSPAVSLGRVYFGTMKGVVHCLDAFSGREYWQLDAGGEGVMSSPAVFADRVYVGTLAGEIVSVDAVTGREHWRFDAHSEIKSSPAATTSGIVFGCKSGHVISVDDRGNQRWRFVTGEAVVSSPAVFADRVYVTVPGWLYCLALDSGAEIWKAERGNDEGNILALTPAVTANGVYVAGTHASDDGQVRGRVYCFDPAGGQRKWLSRWPGPSPGFQSSPAVVGSRVVIGGLDGVIMAIEDGRDRWVNLDLVEWWILASPAIAENVVYLPANDGNLHCFSLSTGESLWKTPLDAETEGASSSPAIAYHRLYVGTSRNGMVCFGEAET